MKTTQPMETINLATQIAVIGAGYAGLKAAARISANGYPVILAPQDNDQNHDKDTNFAMLDVPAAEITRLKALEDEIANNPNVEILPVSTLVEASGMPGDFILKFQSADALFQKNVGAVMVATDTAPNPLNHIYGLTPSANVVSVSEFESRLADENAVKEIQSGKKTVAFLVGFAHEGTPLLMKRVLNCVSAIVDMDDCTAYVYVNNIKVADDGLERLYTHCRNSGAIYFKLQQAPSVIQENDSLTIRFHDPVIRTDIETNPDIIVCEESLIASETNFGLAQALRIDMGSSGFLQNENVHRLPVDSNREGIFVVGAARDVQDLSKSWMDVDNAMLRVKALIGDGTASITAKAVVDREKCVTCLTCFRCCPHGAISWDDKAVISPVACQGCGICASECPMDAIQLVDFADTEMTDRIREAAAASTDSPKIVAFCCQNSAYEAGLAAKAFNFDLPAGLKLVKVPCAGKVDIHYILSALVEGADGVLVLACHTGNCKSEAGNTYAKWRTNDAYKKLEQVGLEKDRLTFATLASNMASDFSRITVEMENKIREIKG